MIFLPFAIEKCVLPGSYGPFFVPPNLLHTRLM
jgi:hypothetical protein